MTRLLSAFTAALVLGGVLLAGCNTQPDATAAASDAAAINAAVTDTATFAGGCFWCMEPPFDTIDGVSQTISGFSGGEEVNPSYREVAMGMTGHTEVVQVLYDSSKVSYDYLLRAYWHNVDPVDGDGQFCDRGSSYRPAIFAHTDAQLQKAQETKETVASLLGQDVAVEIEGFDAFYRAESYHQNYYEKNPGRYKQYRTGCRRDARLKEVWDDKALTAAPLGEEQM